MASVVGSAPGPSMHGISNRRQVATWQKSAWGCLEAIRLIQSISFAHDTFGMVLHIKELCSRDWEVSFSHVKRVGIHVADGMTRMADLDSFNVVSFVAPLNMVAGLVLLEMDDLS
ncbi:hypothetical protein V6N11_018658 [Hibiscus sabdariffa]|uniref:Uncharacterized protein n=1 Tax=Hibiscus sabdariffa TaxID=183260 RepID=A0ABR2QT52_9ROSI